MQCLEQWKVDWCKNQWGIIFLWFGAFLFSNKTAVIIKYLESSVDSWTVCWLQLKTLFEKVEVHVRELNTELIMFWYIQFFSYENFICCYISETLLICKRIFYILNEIAPILAPYFPLSAFLSHWNLFFKLSVIVGRSHIIWAK